MLIIVEIVTALKVIVTSSKPRKFSLATGYMRTGISGESPAPMPSASFFAQ